MFSFPKLGHNTISGARTLKKMCHTLRGSPDTVFENDLIPYDPELKTLMRAFFIEYGGGRRGSPGIGSGVMIYGHA